MRAIELGSGTAVLKSKVAENRVRRPTPHVEPAGRQSVPAKVG